MPIATPMSADFSAGASLTPSPVIATFLGASLFFIAEGIPFLPLQTLWVNFTVTVFLAVGLGYGKARDDLMLDAPRPPSVPILGRRMLIWLVIAGLTMAVVTLGVIAWATPVYGEAVARTMGLTVFSLANIWFAFETAHEEKSIVSSETLANPTLLKTGALAIIATVAASELGLLNRVLDTVNLSTQQWAICLVLSLAVVAVAEIKKLLRIQTTETPPLAQASAAPAVASAG